MSAGDGHLRLERKQKDMADKVREGKVRCSFCHKTEDQVRKLIAGPDGAYICDECIGICSEIMEEEFNMYCLLYTSDHGRTHISTSDKSDLHNKILLNIIYKKRHA